MTIDFCFLFGFLQEELLLVGVRRMEVGNLTVQCLCFGVVVKAETLGHLNNYRIHNYYKINHSIDDCYKSIKYNSFIFELVLIAVQFIILKVKLRNG